MANIRNINLNLVLVFDALMQERNMTRAGEKIGLSQPGMSYSLNKLRHLCGDPLFTRSKGGMQPTKLANELYLPIKQGLDQISEGLMKQAKFEPNTDQTSFRIGMTDYSSALFLPKLSALMHKKAPLCQLNIMHSQRPLSGGQLIDDQVDLAICVLDQRPTTANSIVLYEEKIVMIYDPKYTSVKHKMNMNTFTKHPHLLVNFRESQPSTITRLLKQQNLHRHIRMTIPHVMQAGSIVKGSNMICAVPNKIAEALCREHKLATCECPIQIPSYYVCMVWHARYEQAKAHQWLRTEISKLIS